MRSWHPNAARRPHIDAGDWQAGGHKIVWHTTETRGLPNYGGSAPHFTLDPSSGDLWQHIPLDRAARTLRAGGPNFWRTWQVELLGFARDTADWPRRYYLELAQLARWLERECGVPRRCEVAFSGTSGGARRLTPDGFRAYSGHIGHQHVPGNDHWDPGGLVIASVLDLDAPTPEIPVLARGARGPEVIRLKRRLEALGYRLPKRRDGSYDDGFGRMTEAAVMHFQHRRDLRIDGIVGPHTRNRLNL